MSESKWKHINRVARESEAYLAAAPGKAPKVNGKTVGISRFSGPASGSGRDKNFGEYKPRPKPQKSADTDSGKSKGNRRAS